MCNSRCRYCFTKSENEFGDKLNKKFSFNFNSPVKSEIDTGALREFILKDENPKIIFYGGEPLLNVRKIKEVMDKIPEADYYLQTNGKLIHWIPSEYMNKFSKILVSIDGDMERTDFNRGKGTYDLVMKNVNLIRDKGFRGEIVARMTISFSDGFTDLTKQIRHLIGLGFDSIHWQLDMGFYESDYDKIQVKSFVEKYNKEVSDLIHFWIDEMKKGRVLKIYPFLGLFESLYDRTSTKLRCGSGYANYTITTDGKIVACPITGGINDFCVGDINSNNPGSLKEISVGEPCTSCDYLNLCGGRCLYSNQAKLWPKEGEELICKTIKHIIDSLESKLSEIKSMIDEGIVNRKQFEYEKYFGPEIIP